MADLSKLKIKKEGVETEYNLKDATARSNVTSLENSVKSTYIKGISASGQTITYTKGDNTTGTVTTQDTTYTAATQSADGLMAADDKRKLDNVEENAQKNTVTGVKGSAETNMRTGAIIISPSNLGLGNVENKSSETIRGEITKENVTEALGYTPPTKDTTYGSMTGATSSAAGKSGLVPAPAAGKQGAFLRGDGTWAAPSDTTYTAGTGLSLSNKQFSLASGVVTAGTAGPSADVTGNEGNTIKVPQVTVDTYGRVTGLAEKTYTSKNTTYSAMGGASSSAAGTTGLVPAPAKGKQAAYLRGDGTWNTPTDTTYTAGTGLSLSNKQFSLASGVITAATVGPTGNVTGTEGTTLTVPEVTVDTYGRVTGLTARTYTSKNTTYGTMGAASSSAAGSAGLVPAPAKGNQSSFLRGDATWHAIPTGVKGNAESSYRTGNVNITKANIGLGNVDNTADANKSVSHASTADSATKATQDASGNTITSTYATKTAVDAISKETFNLQREGTLIENGTDLNSLTTPGTYYCPSLDNAESYVNCPVTNRGFKLVVMETGYNAPSNIIQTIYGGMLSGANGYVVEYTRTYGGSTSGWTPWRMKPPINENLYQLFRGTTLYGETNLNNVTEVGSYFSASSTTTNGLSNCPVKDGGFTMHVDSMVGNDANYIRQRLYFKNEEYVRTRAGSSASWSNWYKTLVQQGTLATGTDLNDVNSEGIWFLNGDYTYTNAPATYGLFEVLRPHTTGVTMQRLTTTSAIYYRYRAGTTWYSWKTVPTKDQVDAKADLASPTFTGTPKAPTASAGTKTTQIATTAFVGTAVGNLIKTHEITFTDNTAGGGGQITQEILLPKAVGTNVIGAVASAGTSANLRMESYAIDTNRNVIRVHATNATGNPAQFTITLYYI